MTAGLVSQCAGSLLRSNVDWICCTGDVTEHGRVDEAQAFARAFIPLKHKLTIIPGNHDRLNDNVAAVLSHGACWVREGCGGGLRLVCVDSTQEANATLIIANGVLNSDTCAQVQTLVDARVEGQSVLVLIHHHLVKAPVDDLMELFSEMHHLPFANCLKRGATLANSLVGSAAAVLHGHKHKAAVVRVQETLPIINAGSTTELRRYRVLDVFNNEVVGEQWVAF